MGFPKTLKKLRHNALRASLPALEHCDTCIIEDVPIFWASPPSLSLLMSSINPHCRFHMSFPAEAASVKYAVASVDKFEFRCRRNGRGWPKCLLPSLTLGRT